MPRSKRNTVVALTQTDKKDKAHKGELITTIRQHAEEFEFLWVFEVEHMRNNLLQEVRTAWKGSRWVVIAFLWSCMLCSRSGCWWGGSWCFFWVSHWHDRIFLGRNAVMRKALGATREDECRLGVHKIANVSSIPSQIYSYRVDCLLPALLT